MTLTLGFGEVFALGVLSGVVTTLVVLVIIGTMQHRK